MTFQQKFLDYLTRNGLFPSEAVLVLDTFKTQPAVKDVRFDDPADSLPNFALAALIVSLDKAASDWLYVNKPNHWARPIFDAKLDPESHAKAIFADLP